MKLAVSEVLIQKQRKEKSLRNEAFFLCNNLYFIIHAY